MVRSPKQGNRIINSILGLKGDSREAGGTLNSGDGSSIGSRRLQGWGESKLKLGLTGRGQRGHRMMGLIAPAWSSPGVLCITP